MAGLTVGIIALPLAIGFAIAPRYATTGVRLETGYNRRVSQCCFSAAWRFQIAGPTGALSLVLFSIIAQYGDGGLALAVMMAGVMLITVGALKMGTAAQALPDLIAGFTSGIAVIVLRTTE